jgi:hypothetical protein
METFTLVPRGPFSLAASIAFLEGFTPASYSDVPDGTLELAFPVEGSWRTAGVRAGPATTEQIAAISDKWRPYRTWVTLLLRTLLEDEGTQRVKLGLARGCA